MIMIDFSGEHFDQWRLNEVGGKIVFRKNGEPAFKFDNKEQFDQYNQLMQQRFEGGLK